MTGQRTGSTLYRLDIKALVERPQQERVLVAKQSAASLMTWHRRLSHVNCKTIQQMEASNAVEGMKITDRKLPAICEGCIYGKMCRRSFKCSKKDPKALEIGQLIVSDVGGPMQEKSLSGALYYLSIKDKASGFRQVFFLKKKSEVAGKFKIYIPLSFQNETGKLIKAIRTDNGTEFKGQDWTWVDEMGIKRQYTIPFTPQQNGASERDNRTIVEAARSALYGRKHLVSSLVLLRLWEEAINYAVYTLNRTLSRPRDVSPFEGFYGTKPNISHLRQFGITCYVHKADQKPPKLEKNGEKGMFLGYDNNSTGYLVFILATYKVVVSDEVLFEEDDDSHKPKNHAILREFPFSKEQTNDDEADNQSSLTQKTIPMPKVPLFEPQAQSPIELQAEHPPEPVVNERPPIGERDEADPFHGFEEGDRYPNHHEYEVERDDALSVDIPVIANRRYPLRDRKPKVIHSMNLMDFDGKPFEPGFFSEAIP